MAKYFIIMCLSCLLVLSGCIVTDEKLEIRLAELQQKMNSSIQDDLNKSKKERDAEFAKFDGEMKGMREMLIQKSKDLDKTISVTTALVDSKYKELDTKYQKNQETVKKFGVLYDQLDKIRSESKSIFKVQGDILKKNWEILSSQREQLADEKKALDERISKMDEMIIAIEDALSAINELLGK